jgi:hypothetical protein
MDPNAPTLNTEITEDVVNTSNLPDFHGLLDYTERFLQNFPVNDINTLVEKIYKEREEAELSEFYSNSHDDTVFDITNLDMYDFENQRLDNYNYNNDEEDNQEQLSDYGDNFESSDNDDDFVTV